jgi:hypothetical protein
MSLNFFGGFTATFEIRVINNNSPYLKCPTEDVLELVAGTPY